jgi:hypothetical protein
MPPMNSPIPKRSAVKAQVILGEGLRQGGQRRTQQADQQYPAIADHIAPIAEKRRRNHIGEPGDRKGDAAQGREIGARADHLLDEQSHHRLHRAYTELRHQQHEEQRRKRRRVATAIRLPRIEPMPRTLGGATKRSCTTHTRPIERRIFAEVQ